MFLQKSSIGKIHKHGYHDTLNIGASSVCWFVTGMEHSDGIHSRPGTIGCLLDDLPGLEVGGSAGAFPNMV